MIKADTAPRLHTCAITSNFLSLSFSSGVLVSDRVSDEDNAIGRVRPSVRASVSIPSFESTESTARLSSGIQ